MADTQLVNPETGTDQGWGLEQGTSRNNKRTRATRVVTWTLASIVVLGAVASGAAALSHKAPQYRLATATTGSVSQTLASVGTLQAVQQATLTFPSGGQVAAVNVSQGQRVSAGQTLASLNMTSINSQLSSAQSSLASAQARLANDQAAQAQTAAQQQAAQQQAAAAAQARSAMAGSRTALARAQRSASGAQSILQRAIAADSTCLGSTQSPQTSPAGQGGSFLGTTRSTSTSTSTSTGGTTGTATTLCSSQNQALRNALSQYGVASQDLYSAQNSLTHAIGAYATLLSRSSGSAGFSPGNSRATQGAPGSAQIEADNAAIASAQVKVLQAQQRQAGATLVSPISGTVASVSMSAGQVLGGGSSGASIVVVGNGAFELNTTVPASNVAAVKVGQPVKVLPDGSTTTIVGKVVNVGVVGTQSSSGTVTYPVTVSLPKTASLYPGAEASASIIVGSAHNVLAVPTSAVRVFGSRAIVDTLSNGKLHPVAVRIGARGAILTQVTSGITSGTQVVLANLATPLPTGQTNFRAFGGGGGFRGGGAPGGGPPGGGG